MAYISDILESFLGSVRKHNEESGQISFDCPACSTDKGMPEGDGKGNLEINYEKNVFKCWVCKDTNYMSGSVVRLVKKYGTEKNLRDYKLFKPDAFLSKEDREHFSLKLPEGFQKLSECNPRTFKYKAAVDYLHDRGITDDIIKKYDIGYTVSGQFFNRIIIPSYDEEGILNYFIARWFDKQYNKIKYLNPEAEKQLVIFNEGKINWDANIYLVEGVTDHIVIPNSIPLLGKFMSPILLNKLHEKAKAKIIILLDGDATEDATILYKLLDFGRLYGKIRICIPPEDWDPSLINQKMGKRGIITLLRHANTLKDAKRLEILAANKKI